MNYLKQTKKDELIKGLISIPFYITVPMMVMIWIDGSLYEFIIIVAVSISIDNWINKVLYRKLALRKIRRISYYVSVVSLQILIIGGVLLYGYI